MPKITDTNIKKVYNKIAEGFYNLRQQPITPEIKKLAEEWKPGKLLDIGCGIGNSTLPFAKNGFDCTGIDISPKMLGLAKKYSEKHGAKIKFKVGNILSIPLTENDFDFVISVAVLHHLDSEKKRLRALREIKKVLKPKGKVFITVWNSSLLEASAFCKRLQCPKPLVPNQKDAYIPWTRKGVKYNRYYHFFDQDELKGLFEKSGFKRIRIFEDGRGKNLCVVAEC